MGCAPYASRSSCGGRAAAAAAWPLCMVCDAMQRVRGGLAHTLSRAACSDMQHASLFRWNPLFCMRQGTRRAPLTRGPPCLAPAGGWGCSDQGGPYRRPCRRRAWAACWLLRSAVIEGGAEAGAKAAVCASAGAIAGVCSGETQVVMQRVPPLPQRPRAGGMQRMLDSKVILCGLCS